LLSSLLCLGLPSARLYQSNFVFPISPIFVTWLASHILSDSLTRVFTINRKKAIVYINRLILIIVLISVAYNFKTGSNKIKLLMEYKNVTQNVLLPEESILQTSIRLSFVACRICKLYSNASWRQSASSCKVVGLPAPFPYRVVPLYWNYFNQRRIALSEVGTLPYWVLYRRSILITDFVSKKKKVRTLPFLVQSPFWGMTPYFLPVIAK
jgi:hypothetical protein